MVSGLTMAKSNELAARYVTYPDILDVLREHGTSPAAIGSTLFNRIAFNMAISNSDDHARNHAAFWDGHRLSLTPAFDLAPGNRTGHTATQAMAFDRSGTRTSNFGALIKAAHVYGLTGNQARTIIDTMVAGIRAHWPEAIEHAELTRTQGAQLFGQQILNPGLFHEL